MHDLNFSMSNIHADFQNINDSASIEAKAAKGNHELLCTYFCDLLTLGVVLPGKII